MSRLCRNPKCDNESNDGIGVFDEICEDCDVTFPTEKCLQAHKPEECEKYCLCTVCKKVVKRAKLDDHHCMLVK